MVEEWFRSYWPHVKLFAAFRHVAQQRARFEMARASGNKTVHGPNHGRYSKAVGVAERSAAKWSETGAHDHGEIDVLGFGDDLLFEATGGLVNHQKDHAGLEVHNGNSLSDD